MIRDILIYAVVLVAALGLAYQSSLPKSASESAVVNWVDISADSIQSVELTSPKLSVLAQKSGGKFWIDFNSTGEEGQPAEQENFLANKEFKEMVESFGPFEVMRVIGKVEESGLNEFGLGSTAGRLVVKYGQGKEFTLKLGSKPYSSSNRYVYDEAKGSVLLIAGRHIEKFERARNRLYERDITDIKWDELVAAELTVGDRSKKLIRTRKGDDGVVGWSTEAEDSKPKALFQNWFGKLEKLKLTAFGTGDETKLIEAIPPFMTVSLANKQGQSEKLEFRKSDNNGAITYWIKSDFIGAFAKLNQSRLDTIEKDLAPILEER
jgi:hypothetical protein